jgi:glycosyltransferase involved in cell wall biosynthesis
MSRRVLQVLGRSAGGTARHVAQIVERLDGGDGLVVDIAGPPEWPVAMPKPVYPVAIPNGPLGHGHAIRALRGIITLGHYDVCHAHGLRAGLDSALSLRATRVPAYVSVHNLVRPDVAGRGRHLLYRPMEPLLVALAARVFAASAEIAASLRRAAPRHAHKVEVLHLGVGDPPEHKRPAAEVRAALGVGPGDRLVVTAARLSPQKALHVLLGAIARLPSAVVLAVLGEGPSEAELRATAERLGISGRVRWLGWREDVADHLAAADVFCLSSNWEACALAAQEAMQLGTVVVSTRVGGMPELVSDGQTGRLVPKGDEAALARALDEVLGSAELRARLAARAREHLAAEFSSERMLERLAEAYRGAGRAP